jgi:hypothetical protein
MMHKWARIGLRWTDKRILAEEEISDVSLATFYVFDKENAHRPGCSLRPVAVGMGVDMDVAAAAVAAAFHGDVAASAKGYTTFKSRAQ